MEGEPKNIAFILVHKVYKPPRAGKEPDFIYRRLRPKLEICVNSGHRI